MLPNGLRIKIPALCAVGLFFTINLTSGCQNEPQPVPQKPQSAIQTSSAPAVRDSQTIILVADVWPPYNCALGDPLEGYMVDVAREIFEPLGYRVKYDIVPWKRALSGTMSGTYDGAIGTTKVEGKGLIFPQLELMPYQVSFIVQAGDPWRFSGEASLDSMRLGAAHGYDYVTWLNDYIVRFADQPDRVQVITGDDPLAQNLKKLMAGHIDVIAGDGGAIFYASRQMELTHHIQSAGRDPERSNCYIGFSPGTGTGEHLAQIFDKGFNRLRANGRFDEILDKYGLKDWVH